MKTRSRLSLRKIKSGDFMRELKNRLGRCSSPSMMYFFNMEIVMNNNNDNAFNEVYEMIMHYGTEAMPKVMEVLFNEAMKIERQHHIGVDHYARSNNRIDYANGYKSKQLKTRIGALDLKVPQTRRTDFYPSCLERGLRSERALNLALVEMYIQGTSTRKVKRIVEQMCGFLKFLLKWFLMPVNP